MKLKNVLVGQSGGPTSVINSSLAGVFKTSLDMGCEKIYGMRYGIQGFIDENYIDLSDYIKNNMDIEILKRTPASFLGTCRYKLPSVDENEVLYKNIFVTLEKLNIGYFFYIGGNDSMDTIMKLGNYAKAIGSDIRFMGVPKTIDNDLAETDHTPGFASASKYVAVATKEIISDAKTYPTESVTIIEVMGRNAGWLTASTYLSKSDGCEGPDLIYLPERFFDHNSFIENIERVRKEKKAIVVAVSEGLKSEDGKYLCEGNKKRTITDSFGHKFLGGTALYLSDFLTDTLGIKSRGIVFSTLQRCASHMVSRRDITEAFMVGADAVVAALNGESGKMVCIKRLSNVPYNAVTELCDIEKIANREKRIPDDLITNNGTYISSEFEEYAKPLIIGELEPFMVDGLPMHMGLN